MSDKCGSCDCADQTQCVKKGTSYTLDFVETEESYNMSMDFGAEENGCQCKCGSSCSCVNCTCYPN